MGKLLAIVAVLLVAGVAHGQDAGTEAPKQGDPMTFVFMDGAEKSKLVTCIRKTETVLWCYDFNAFLKELLGPVPTEEI